MNRFLSVTAYLAFCAVLAGVGLWAIAAAGTAEGWLLASVAVVGALVAVRLFVHKYLSFDGDEGEGEL